MFEGCKMPKEVVVAVADVEYKKAVQVFSAAENEGFTCVCAPVAESELAAMIHDQKAAHAIVGVEKYSDELYVALPRGSVLARFGVGHDGIDKERATREGIFCTNTPGALDDSVAEHAIALILSVAHRICGLNTDTLSGGWTPVVGAELSGASLSVIGCGPIGCQVARIAAFGFGMKVTGCEVRDVDTDEYKRRYGFDSIVKDFSEAVKESDFVSLHIPSLPATRHFIDERRLGEIPAGAWLINTARGAVVDEAALYDALFAGRLAGGALDVFETEPYSPVSAGKDLRTLPNIIMTPHVGSATRQACERMAVQALHNISLALKGEYGQMDLLNPEVLNK